jgi:hypothetical protein
MDGILKTKEIQIPFNLFEINMIMIVNCCLTELKNKISTKILLKIKMLKKMKTTNKMTML